jgi:hypothetical protein
VTIVFPSSKKSDIRASASFTDCFSFCNLFNLFVVGSWARATSPVLISWMWFQSGSPFMAAVFACMTLSISSGTDTISFTLRATLEDSSEIFLVVVIGC